MRKENRRIFHRLSSAPEYTPDITQIFSCLPSLETQRLRLRMMTMHDAQDIFSYSSDPQVALHCLWEAHRSIGDTRGYLRFIIRQYRTGTPSSWGIVSKESGRMIGTIGFMSYDSECRTCEVGYSLARSQWNRGYATQALRSVLAFSFETMKLHRVEALHETDNPSSGRVMEKCGMIYEGTMRSKVINKGHYSDVCLWSMLQQDWFNQQKKIR